MFIEGLERSVVPIAGERDKHLVLYDGECGFCRRSLGWLRRHLVPQAPLCFMPFQQAEISPLLRQRCEGAMHVITRGGMVLSAGRAALFCLEYTRFRPWARVLRAWPLLPLVEGAYRLVARNRMLLSRYWFVKEPEDAGDAVPGGHDG